MTTPNLLEARYKAAKIREDKMALCSHVALRVLAYQKRYEKVAEKTGVPWWAIGIIHCLESSCDFSTHLHNGDPLSSRTVHVPRGRPTTGEPPFTWEVSAIDALGHDRIASGSLGEILDTLERYNGLGYRNGAGQRTTPRCTSPYLWSMTDQYIKGKYVADGAFNPEAVSQQVGAVALMKMFEEKGVKLFPDNEGEAPRTYTEADVGWFEIHTLSKDGLVELGVIAKIGGTDTNFATARFSADTELQRNFFKQFPNAASRVRAAPDKRWPAMAQPVEPEEPAPRRPSPLWTGRRVFKRSEDIQLTENFHLSEFECKCGCSTTVLTGEHVAAMQVLRSFLGEPIHITSAYRCPAHNKRVGGAANSQHLTGNACDIVANKTPTWKVFEVAEKFFNGRGFYPTFTHVDSRATKATWQG